MVRAGLGPTWKCLFANDFDAKKAKTYRDNWGDGELFEGDVKKVGLEVLPKATPDLIWASFPCQDLSLAGGGAGLKGDRSGTFWPFWTLVRQLAEARRTPSIIVLENVCGALTSHEGKDFKAIVEAFVDIGFDVGAMVIDAELFVPHSRPRLFFIGVPAAKQLSLKLSVSGDRSFHWHPPALKRAYASLSETLQSHWIWWDIPLPQKRNVRFADLVEKNPPDVTWNTDEETDQLLGRMSPVNLNKVEMAKVGKKRVVGTMYRRTRPTGDGDRIQRVEVRFDDVAGCLRTPAGGSSRQSLLVVEGERVRSRLISARETARLMGLDDSYMLPNRYNEAYHLTGDGVVVPVVKHLADKLFLNLLPARKRSQRPAHRSADSQWHR